MKRPTKQKKNAPPAPPPDGQPPARSRRIDTMLDPAANAALVVDAFGAKIYGQQHLGALTDALRESVDATNRDPTKAAEIMLATQAQALQSMFVHMALRAACQEQPQHSETFAKLAFKAQHQCRATLETLSLIKNPPSVSIIRQANVGQAVQVVNGAPSEMVAPSVLPVGGVIEANRKLLGDAHVEAMDRREAGATGEAHPTLAPVGAIHRAAD